MAAACLAAGCTGARMKVCTFWFYPNITNITLRHPRARAPHPPPPPTHAIRSSFNTKATTRTATAKQKMCMWRWWWCWWCSTRSRVICVRAYPPRVPAMQMQSLALFELCVRSAMNWLFVWFGACWAIRCNIGKYTVLYLHNLHKTITRYINNINNTRKSVLPNTG